MFVISPFYGNIVTMQVLVTCIAYSNILILCLLSHGNIKEGFQYSTLCDDDYYWVTIS